MVLAEGVKHVSVLTWKIKDYLEVVTCNNNLLKFGAQHENSRV